MRAKSQTSVGKLAVPPIQGVIHYCHRQSFFSPRTDRCCFPWMGMSCRSSGQACIRRDSRGCSLPSKNIQDWSRVDTFKLSYHDNSCPPEVTNWAGKAACFRQLMRAYESQVSNKRWGIQKLSWPSLQVKDLSKAISRNRFFFARTDRCCFPWMGMSCRSSGQACIRRDSRGCSLPSKNIQDWSRVDTFKLSYHDKRCPPELTN